MAVRDPGFSNDSKNRRVNRYSAGNRADRRHKLFGPATTVSFTAPDGIADSGDGLGIFEPDEDISLLGSTSNDGEYNTDTVAVGAIATIEQTVVNETAGDSVTISSLNNRTIRRFG